MPGKLPLIKDLTIDGHFVDLRRIVLFFSRIGRHIVRLITTKRRKPRPSPVQLTNVTKNFDVVALDKVDSNTFPAEPTRPTDTVDVVFTIRREIVVDPVSQKIGQTVKSY